MAGERRNQFGDGALRDRHGRPWHRIADWVEPDDVHRLLADRTSWVIERCEGGFRWSDHDASDEHGRELLLFNETAPAPRVAQWFD